MGRSRGVTFREAHGLATVNRYLCPVAPGECPSSPRRGFCPNHEWERLVPGPRVSDG
ncbi:hypothetical protein SMICM17S_12746 [Streptomyces microflavus]